MRRQRRTCDARGVVKVEVPDVKAEVHPEDKATFHSLDYRRKHEANDGHLCNPHLQPHLMPHVTPHVTPELYPQQTTLLTSSLRPHTLVELG